MSTFGWILLAFAFLIFMAVANNSWPWIWSKISGMPLPGSNASGGTTTTPSQSQQPSIWPPQLSPPPMQIPNPNDPNGPPLTVMG